MPLWVHLAWDGGIFVMRDDTGERRWTDREDLELELAAAKERDDLLFYSRERVDEDPPAQITDVFREIMQYDLPMKLLDEAPPEALRQPDEPRDIAPD